MSKLPSIEIDPETNVGAAATSLVGVDAGVALLVLVTAVAFAAVVAWNVDVNVDGDVNELVVGRRVVASTVVAASTFGIRVVELGIAVLAFISVAVVAVLVVAAEALMLEVVVAFADVAGVVAVGDVAGVVAVVVV